jgi:hypothetical protein
MSDAQYKKLFPTEIPLGKSPATLFLSGAPGLEQIPDDGYILIHVQKQPAETPDVGGLPEDTGAPAAPSDGGVELAVLSVCLPEQPDENDESDPYGFDKAARKAGINPKKGDEMESSAEAAAETPADEDKEG